MADPSERDAELLSQMLQEFLGNPGDAAVWPRRNAVVLKYLSMARDQGRAEERERCAKIVNDAGPACDFVAKRIRGGE